MLIVFLIPFSISFTGPLGRNIEGDVSLRSPAAVYTYSKTRGLFAGISIEGSALIERKDANKKYGFLERIIIGKIYDFMWWCIMD